MTQSSMVGLSSYADDLPSDLVAYLIGLIQRGGNFPSLPSPEIPFPEIPPLWRRWLPSLPTLPSPDELARRAGGAAQVVLDETARELRRRARLQALDLMVGGPCLSIAAVFANTGHADAALLLREFVRATGPQTRTFGWNSTFSLGFARSETTMPSTARALNKWKTRAGGIEANGGRITGLSNTFVPIRPTIRLLPVPGPSAEIYGSAEAHVIGSYAYSGRSVDGVAEWRAANQLSLRSFFADNWTKRVNVTLVDNNHRPERYGNTDQVIYWRTTLTGEVIG